MSVDAYVLVMLLLAAGVACARLQLLPDNAAEVLNKMALNVLLPAAVLRFASQLVLDARLLGLIAVPWLLLAASVVLVRWLARRLAWAPEARAVLLLCVPLGNTAFLGYPLIEAMLGKAALPFAVAYDQFGSFIILSTFGLWVLARYGGDEKPTFAAMAGRVLRFPAFLALVAALLLMPDPAPPVLARLLERLSDALLPVVALAIGLQLRFRIPAHERTPLAVGLSLKLLVLPALAWALVWAQQLPSPMAEAAVLESAMAPMISAGALAISHRLAPGLAAALVGFGTPLSLLTLWAWRWLLGVP